MTEESFIDKAICRNCIYYINGRCEQRPIKSLVNVETGEHNYIYQETTETEHCGFFTDNSEAKKNKLYDAYKNIEELLRKYCDLKEEDYSIIATWIIGTYFHDKFYSYPYLFLNAMKGSGKTRTLKLITDLAKEGEVLLQPTEAVLFRTKGTLGIDEAESLTRKGFENLRELLNASYKKGSKVKRMKQKKTPEGTIQIVESFDVYRPLVIANINGMEDVLGDRCINVVIERSDKQEIIKLVEMWEEEQKFIETKELLNQCSLCSVVSSGKLYTDYNIYILNINNNINNINYTTNNILIDDNKNLEPSFPVEKKLHLNNTNYTKLFKNIVSLDLNGREMELSLPLLIISNEISPEVFEKLHLNIKSYMMERKEDQFSESRDIMLTDMISQEVESGFISIKEMVAKFLTFTQEDNYDNEINTKWMGRALKRLRLIKEKKRLAGGIYVILNIEKAQEKMRMFK